jgi:hypothetical protein
MAEGASGLPQAKDAGISSREAGGGADSRDTGEGATVNRRETSKNKARVRKVLKLLRRVKCDNFRVVGAGSWTSPVASLAGKSTDRHIAQSTRTKQ